VLSHVSSPLGVCVVAHDCDAFDQHSAFTLAERFLNNAIMRRR